MAKGSRLLQKMKELAKADGIELDSLPPGERFEKFNKYERIVRFKFPDFVDDGPEIQTINSAETEKVNRYLEKHPNSSRDLLAKLEGDVIRMRAAVIDAELRGVENAWHPLVRTKGEAKAAEKHPLLFSSDPADWKAALEFSRNTLAAETTVAIRDTAAARGVRFTKLNYLDQIADLAGISVDELKLRFPGWTTSAIVEFVAGQH